MLFIILILIIKPFSNLLSENGYFESTLFIKYIINFVNSVNYEKDIIYNRLLYIVYNLLFNGEIHVPEIVGKIGNQEPTNPYQNKKDVQYLKLLDTREIELAKALSVNNIGNRIHDFIQEQLSKKI